MEKESGPSRVAGTVKAPSSKSYAQRAIAAALLAEGTTTIRNINLCSDTQAAMETAIALGAVADRTGESSCAIRGGMRSGRLTPVRSTLDVGESGLSARMFTPIAALADQPVTITGRGTIMSRPLGMAAGPLSQLGVTVRSTRDMLPVTLSGSLRGGEARVDATISSQLLTGLLMALPLAPEDTTLWVSDPVSTPYIDMTLRLLEDFGITVSHSGHTEFFIEGRQSYIPREYDVEGDWSGASCILVAGAIAGEVVVENLNPLSLQADVAVIEALSRAGAEITTGDDRIAVRRRELTAFSFDATHSPDLFPALVALAANCEGVSSIKGVARLTAKECDRAKALPEVFGQLGIEISVDRRSDTMLVRGGTTLGTTLGATVDSHGDHRIAMAAAVAGLRSHGGVTVTGAEAVSKSYPEFWNDLDSIRIK